MLLLCFGNNRWLVPRRGREKCLIIFRCSARFCHPPTHTPHVHHHVPDYEASILASRFTFPWMARNLWHHFRNSVVCLCAENSLIRVAQAIKMRHFSARKYFISQPLLFYHYTRSSLCLSLNSFNVFKILFIVDDVFGLRLQMQNWIYRIFFFFGRNTKSASRMLHGANCGA